MAGDTITRAQLSEAVYEEVGLSRNESADLVEAVLEEMVNALSDGETVKISSFGSFSIRQKSQRMGRNPKTGEKVNTPQKKTIHFKMAKDLFKKLNNEK